MKPCVVVTLGVLLILTQLIPSSAFSVPYLKRVRPSSLSSCCRGVGAGGGRANALTIGAMQMSEIAPYGEGFRMLSMREQREVLHDLLSANDPTTPWKDTGTHLRSYIHARMHTYAHMHACRTLTRIHTAPSWRELASQLAEMQTPEESMWKTTMLRYV